MSENILDTPFLDSFEDHLEKGETILWKGKPSIKSPYNNRNHYADETPSIKYPIVKIILFLTVLFFSWSIKGFVIGMLIALGFYLLRVIYPYWPQNIGDFYYNNLVPRFQKDKFFISYALTQRQLLFQFEKKHSAKIECKSILLSQIRNIIVVMQYDIKRMREDYESEDRAFPTMYEKEGLDKIGTIYLVLHDPTLVDFETKDLITNNKRHQPTLELLDDVNKVAKMIREGIRTNAK